MISSNTHIPHLEDEIFMDAKGIHVVLQTLKEMQSYLQTGISSLNVTTKWDGAPAIVCGTDAYGYFFVSTKAIFNKNPVLLYTFESIKDYTSNQILRQKLATCLEYLPELNIKGILQGDMMYSEFDLYSTDEHICFKPNVVEYKVPLNTNLGKHIEESAMGIVFHTSYNSFLTEANYKVDVGALTSSKNVWFRDATLVNAIGLEAFFTENENQQYNDYLRAIKQLIRNCPQKTLNTFSVNETIKSLTQRYINATIRKGESVFDTAGLILFVDRKLQEDISSAKKLGTIINRKTKKKEIMDWFILNLNGLCNMFEIYEMTIQAKTMLLNKLNQMKDIETNCIPEGYVVSGLGSLVKLVDRPNFSYQNFNMEKSWRTI